MLNRRRQAEALILQHGLDRCELFPDVGGSIGAWTVQGQAMLRAAGAASVTAYDPYGMASFPLVPYSNRIANGSFEWNGSRITLARNFPPEPHAIHGVGFEQPWACASRTADSALLTLNHRPDAGWPWPFEAQQRITLADRELTLELRAVNLAPHSAPLAFGHHPYFPRSGARLQFEARSVWLVGDDGLPSEPVPASGRFDFAHGAAVERGPLDHCFTGWNGCAAIVWPGKPFALEITGSPSLSAAVVYSRSGAEGFCFEPVPHLNNALNMAGCEPAMPVMAPGAAFSSSIRFRAVAR
jgi:aldose 1-epimerase